MADRHPAKERERVIQMDGRQTSSQREAEGNTDGWHTDIQPKRGRGKYRWMADRHPAKERERVIQIDGRQTSSQREGEGNTDGWQTDIQPKRG